jgi:hypothetical protein
MSATAISICSNALLLLGDKPISDFNEDNDRARLASNLWPMVRDAVLRSHPWNCAIKRVALAPETVGPAFDWTFQFLLPPDFLKALSVGRMGNEGEFKIEGRRLLCDDNPCLLRYVFANDNPGSYDSLLVEIMTMSMAHRMAYAITQSAAMADSMGAQLERLLRRARAVDGQDDSPETLGDSPLVNVRYSGSRNWG